MVALLLFRFGMTVPGTCCDILVSDIPFPQCLGSVNGCLVPGRLVGTVGGEFQGESLPF